METATVGRVLVAATIENVVDLYLAAKGSIKPEEVHRVEVSEALVDTGASHLCLPRRLIQQLGFDKPYATRTGTAATGKATAGLFGPVRLTIQERIYHGDVAEVADDCPVLIGQLPLEALDFVVDPRAQRLIGNPRHGGEHMIDLY